MILWYKMCQMFCLIMINRRHLFINIIQYREIFWFAISKKARANSFYDNSKCFCIHIDAKTDKLFACSLDYSQSDLTYIQPIFHKRKLLDSFSNLDYYLVPFVNKVIGHDCRHKTAAVVYLRRHRLMSAASL